MRVFLGQRAGQLSLATGLVDCCEDMFHINNHTH